MRSSSSSPRTARAARTHSPRGRACPPARPRLARDQAHRIASVREAAARFACVVVLKGADTLVAEPGRGLLVSALGLPSLATAGTGDVLTGVIAAFLAKGMDAQLAAVAGAAAQQRASVEAEQRTGLIASDVVEALPRALR